MIIEQIREDRARALEANDPTGQVCYLATVDADGSPSVRTLVLREVSERSVRLFINASSPKWQALSANSACQILLWYPSIQIQYRLSGAAAMASRADIENNWHRRPLRAKLLDYFYAARAAQSEPYRSSEDFDQAFESMAATLDPESLTPPIEAIAVDIALHQIERLDLTQNEKPHRRARFRWIDEAWAEDFLVP